MDFTDEGILISAKPLGEANAVAEILTAAHGRHLGLVRGGRSRRLRPLLQPGNLLSLSWRARLADHLGGFAVELIDPLAARVLDDQAALYAIGSLTSLVKLLPERDPHPELYHGALQVLRALDDGDLGACAATGVETDLAFVSPRSGRAVSRHAGEAYGDRLLKLPAFLVEDKTDATPQDVILGLTLTGHFLERHVLAPHGQSLPRSRERLIGLLARRTATALP
jgi:DNA repair protein RecO (recombination protein O)